MATLGIKRIADTNIKIEVNDAGVFSASFEEETFSGKTMEQLEGSLKAAIKKAKELHPVDVSVVGKVPKLHDPYGHKYTDGVGVVHAILRKRHDRSAVYLFTAADGTKFQLSSYHSRDHICRRLTDEETAEYLRLRQAVEAAKVVLEAWTEERRVNADEALKGTEQ